MAVDTIYKDFIINKLTQKQFNDLAEINEGEVYVLTDAEGPYTKSETDTIFVTKEDFNDALDTKSDKNNTYTKSETDDLLDKKLDIDTAEQTYETITNVNNHISNVNNPHNVTKAQIGLGNVDNTSDADKPISTATQEALDLKANADEYVKKSGDEVTGPLILNAEDTSSGSIFGKLITLKAKTENGDIKSEHIITMAPFGGISVDGMPIYSLGNISAINGNAEIGNKYTSWGKIYIKKINNGSDIEIPNKTGTLALIEDLPDVYTKTESNNLLDKKLDIDTAASTYETITNVNNHKNDINNPHKVTKAQVGLSNVDNTSDTDKPISTATQEALDLKADKNDTYTKTEVDAKVSSVYRFKGSVADEKSLPTSELVTGDVYNVEDTGANYAWNGVSWDKLSETIDLTPYLLKNDASSTYETITNVNNHKNNTNNPHNVTKAQVGLSNVDNTSDTDKPISTATQEALDLKADKNDTYTKTEVDNKVKTVDDKVTNNTQEIATIKNSKADSSDLSSHTSNTSNPHEVTAAQIGLGNVDNTSDADKPISIATQTALDLKADKSTTYTKSQTDAAIKVVSDKVTTNTASITSLNQSVEALQGSKADTTDLSSHTSNTSNPHNVTKAQVGLGNVDNTADLDKPISTAVQTALDKKANITDIIKDVQNISSTNIYNSIDDLPELDASKNGTRYLALTNGSLPLIIYSWTYNTKTWDKIDQCRGSTVYINIETGKAYYYRSSTPHLRQFVGASEWGSITGTLSNQTDLNTALESKADKSTTYTKTEVDDAINEIDTKANKNAEDIESLANNKANISDLNAHIDNKENPHAVTKAQVGLGNVDNTSDTDKPISTATQEALDLKQNTLTAGDNITIKDNTISAKDTTYTAGDGIEINNNIITNTRVSAKWGNIDGDIEDQIDLKNSLDSKVNIKQGIENAGKSLVIDDNGNVIVGSSQTEVDNDTIIVKDKKITAVGVIEQNNQVSKFDWVGTLEEYNINNICIEHPDWVCYIIDDMYGGESVYTKSEVDSLLEKAKPIDVEYDNTNSRLIFK